MTTRKSKTKSLHAPSVTGSPRELAPLLGAGAESLDATKGRRHDRRSQTSIATNGTQQLAGNIGALDATLDAFTKIAVRFEERLGSGQHDNWKPMCQIVRQLDRCRAIDVRKRKIDKKEIEGLASNL